MLYRADTTVNRRSSFPGLVALALSPFAAVGCGETEKLKPNKPDPRVEAENLLRQQKIEKTKEIKAAQAAWDQYFIDKLNEIDVHQEDKAKFYKEVESLADKVLEYNTSVLRGYVYNALPEFFIAFEKFAIENIEGFRPKYNPLYSKPQEQWQFDHNETLKLSQLAIDVEKHCESLLRARQR